MNLNKWFLMPLWKLRIFAQLFQINILSIEIWRRVKEGEGWLELGARILRYVFLILFAMLSWQFCVISSVYAWFRLADNLLDGDAQFRIGENLETYIAERSKVLDSLLSLEILEAQVRQEDILLAYFIRETKNHPVFAKLCEQLQRLWLLIQSDAQRRTKRPIVSRSELDEFDFEQDASILRFCVLVLNGNEKRLQVVVEALSGLFSRTDCLLDCFDDIRKGIPHIPAEAFEDHGMSLETMRNCQSEQELFALPGVREWRQEERKRISHSWLAAMRVIGSNFGNVFSSAVLNKIVQFVIYMRFYRSFFNLST